MPYTYDYTNRLDLAASLAGCDPDTLLSHRIHELGVVIICANGQKHAYTLADLDAQRERLKAATSDGAGDQVEATAVALQGKAKRHTRTR